MFLTACPFAPLTWFLLSVDLFQVVMMTLASVSPWSAIRVSKPTTHVIELARLRKSPRLEIFMLEKNSSRLDV